MTTETKIIEQTIEMIGQEGYQNLSLRKLTRSLGMTTGAFYKHFKGKNDLFAKTAQKLSHDFIRKVHLNKDQDPKQQLLKIGRDFCTSAVKQPELMDFLFFNPAISTVYQKKNESNFGFLDKVRQLIGPMKLPEGVSPEQFFIQIWSFIQGYAYLIKNKITIYNDALVARTLTQFLLGRRS